MKKVTVEYASTRRIAGMNDGGQKERIERAKPNESSSARFRDTATCFYQIRYDTVIIYSFIRFTT